MAAFRRVAALAGKVNLLAAARYEQVGGQAAGGGRTRRGLAVGTCLATGGAVALYFYRDTTSRAGSKRMERRRVTGPLPTIPSVEAKEKVGRGAETPRAAVAGQELRGRSFSSVWAQRPVREQAESARFRTALDPRF